MNVPDGTPRTPLRLWLALFGGPLAWFAHLSVSYALAALGCGGDSAVLLHLVTGVAVALQLAGALIAWRLRPGFLPQAAIALNAFFLAVVLLAGTPPLALPGCG
ncbi:hypothetical protein ABXN37_13455 [Piscinibacter sakaiensis]|uniref:Uncharacterized protein n=1 Tax=Piscinibacter sakaiensis TaxID=1547922 RepID=A0A0K8P0V5_PISS1|nr:hypothetical protein [Piscinibacter sakaiensis]GAP36159.1 hypothetical protein ISF6_1999 [Piscinibacter sakaiensis]